MSLCLQGSERTADPMCMSSRSLLLFLLLHLLSSLMSVQTLPFANLILHLPACFHTLLTEIQLTLWVSSHLYTWKGITVWHNSEMGRICVHVCLRPGWRAGLLSSSKWGLAPCCITVCLVHQKEASDWLCPVISLMLLIQFGPFQFESQYLLFV